ncbi:MAG: DNA polymerase II [Paraglaciecola sp.]|nr:DNA polymerase II [Paraglaciecola sp.]NCT48858.1 DNA polymerase II [Paraglaciecola sp.]
MLNTFHGFILTCQAIETPSGTCLELWLNSDKGPIKALSETQKSTFFVSAKQAQEVKYLLAQQNIPFTMQALSLKTFSHDEVSAVYFDKPQQAYSAREKLRLHGVVCYEDDIRLSERFLMERFVYGSAMLQGKVAHTPGLQISAAKLKPSDYQPVLRVLSLDIECSADGELYCIGLVGLATKVVLMIGPPPQQESEHAIPTWLKWVNNEKALLIELIEQVQAIDPDVIIGWNVVNFDFRLLIKRAALYNLKLNLGRERRNAEWRDARNEVNLGFVSMPGRVVVDGIDALKTATYQFNSFSLENVAQQLLGQGKASDDVENRLTQIEHDFQHDKIKLARYNLQDCELVLAIFAHTKVLDFLTLRSQLTGLELDRMGGSVAAFVNLYLPRLHRAGYVAPNRPNDGGLASPGGYVMNSQPGLYEHVLVLDFKSLYPSIIRTFKIDPLGLVEGLNNPSNAIPGYRGAVFHREKHFLPDIITTLWQQRDAAKKNQDSVRSQAIKILMNSFYGVLGSGGCPFYDTRLASSITLRGHDIMQTTAAWIQAQGYQVIYGDTDSTFVWLKDVNNASEAKIIGTNLQDHINRQWQQKIHAEYQLDCFLEIEFETYFSQFLMPTIRGSELGSKKRYAGLKEGKQGQELVFKGLENVRSDWTQLAKDFQLSLYQRVFAKQAVADFIQRTIAAIHAGKHDGDLIYRKRLRRPLAHYVKNVPPHVRAARLADEYLVAKGKQAKYQHRGVIAYMMTVNGPEPLENRQAKIDYEHYVEKQIQPIAEAILPFIGLNFSTLVSEQLSLF